MIMRFLRMLCGRSRRTEEILQVKRQHAREFEAGAREVRAKVLVIEALVDQLQKDTRKWS